YHLNATDVSQLAKQGIVVSPVEGQPGFFTINSSVTDIKTTPLTERSESENSAKGWAKTILSRVANLEVSSTLAQRARTNAEKKGIEAAEVNVMHVKDLVNLSVRGMLDFITFGMTK